MWIVIKYKSSELNILKNNLSKVFNNKILFYLPKITYKKNFFNKEKKLTKHLLNNYIFCKHEEFQEEKNLFKIKFLKGLQKIVAGYKYGQNDICSFINFCKDNENSSGNLETTFFSKLITSKINFLSGPFSGITFDILTKNKNFFLSKIGEKKFIIKRKNQNFYSPA